MNQRLVYLILAAMTTLLLSQTSFAGVADDLVGYWKLDETSGTAVVDSTGTNSDGLNVGADINQAAVVGTGYQMLGLTEDDYIEVPDPANATPNPVPDIGTAFTLSAWINPNNTRAGTNSASRSTIFAGPVQNLHMSIGEAGTAGSPAKLITYYDTRDDTNVTGAATTFKTAALIDPNGGWYHVALTRSDGDVKMYINGVEQYSSAVGPVGQLDDLGVITIGRYGIDATATDRDWDGQLDDIGLWNAQRSGEEIALIAGLGKFVGLGLNVHSIDNVLAAFNAASGSAGAGGYAWNYVTGLSSSTMGESGGSVGGSDAWIALDASGNGVQIGAHLHDGDANGDGKVNLADLQILGDNWQSTGAIWDLADFSGDGSVNLADLQILGDNWGFGVGPDISFDEALALVGVTVPEPTSLLLLSLGGLLTLRRRG